MSSETTLVTTQCCLQEWASQIRECQSRPAGMSVTDWCASHGITKANYYYRLRRVREACLESLPEEIRSRYFVPVGSELLQQEETVHGTIVSGLDIFLKEYSIHVTESTPMPLLAAVLEVIKHAE